METLEEAAQKHDKYVLSQIKEPGFSYNVFSFIEGTKWQAERMYYEEEVIDLIADWTKMAEGLNMNFPADKFEDWFKKMKKK
jgi:hypothetical protein